MSEQARHTPGPWRTDGRPANCCTGIDRYGRNWQQYVEKDNSTVVSRCHGATQEEAKANARLIALTPELYAELKAACDNGGAMTNAMLIRSRALLKKATGGAQ